MGGTCPCEGWGGYMSCLLHSTCVKNCSINLKQNPFEGKVRMEKEKEKKKTSGFWKAKWDARKCVNTAFGNVHEHKKSVPFINSLS